jgi:hypothetical protein
VAAWHLGDLHHGVCRPHTMWSMAGTSVYGPELVFAKGTDGLYEIEPSMRWNPAVVAGVGMIPDPSPLYRDMHSYLASAGLCACSRWHLVAAHVT